MEEREWQEQSNQEPLVNGEFEILWDAHPLGQVCPTCSLQVACAPK